MISMLARSTLSGDLLEAYDRTEAALNAAKMYDGEASAEVRDNLQTALDALFAARVRLDEGR